MAGPRSRFHKLLSEYLAGQLRATIAAVHAMRKEESPLAERILAQIGAGNAVLLQSEAQDILEEVMRDGSAVAFEHVGFNATPSIVNQVNALALEYAQERSAEMVGMKWIDGELVENPNAQWAIDDATREGIRADVEAAIETGASNDRLAATLSDNYAFSDDRAEMIARTETAFADVQGNLDAYKQAGIEAKEWKASQDACDECENLEGVIVPIDEDFPDDGGDGPPLHPNCRCDVLPVVQLEAQAE